MVSAASEAIDNEEVEEKSGLIMWKGEIELALGNTTGFLKRLLNKTEELFP